MTTTHVIQPDSGLRRGYRDVYVIGLPKKSPAGVDNPKLALLKSRQRQKEVGK